MIRMWGCLVSFMWSAIQRRYGIAGWFYWSDGDPPSDNFRQPQNGGWHNSREIPVGKWIHDGKYHSGSFARTGRLRDNKMPSVTAFNSDSLRYECMWEDKYQKPLCCYLSTFPAPCKEFLWIFHSISLPWSLCRSAVPTRGCTWAARSCSFLFSSRALRKFNTSQEFVLICT